MLRKIWKIGEPDIGTRSSVFRIVKGPENQVPEDDVVAVIGVGFFKSTGMMPAVELGHTENVVEGAEFHIDVAVLEEAVNGGPNRIKKKQFFPCAKQDEWTRSNRVQQRGINGMKAAGVEPVEPGCAVMDGMKAPQYWDFVEQSMDPVFTELTDDHGERQLEEQWQGVGPQTSIDKSTHLCCCSEEGCGQQGVYQARYTDHRYQIVREIGGNIAMRLTPSTVVWVDPLTEANDEDADGRYAKKDVAR